MSSGGRRKRGDRSKRSSATLDIAYARRQDARAEPIFLLVGSLARQKRVAEALDLCDRAWQNCPSEAVGGISVAVLRTNRPDDEQCGRVEKRLREAIQKHPQSVNLLLQLADLLHLRGRFDDSEAVYRQILDKDNRNVVALNNLAWLLAHKPGKGTEALPLSNRAIEVAGPKADLLDTRAVAYLAIDRSEPAIADLEKAIADGPNGYRYFHLARAYRLAKNKEAASEAFRKATASGLEADQLHPVEQVVYRELSKE